MPTRWRVCTVAWTFPAITEAILKPLVFVLLGLPLLVLGYDLAGELNVPGSRLGADPGEAVLHYLGDWGIWMLLLTLSVSSVRRLTGRAAIMRYRRMIGLYAFAYLCLHFLAYLGFFAGFEWQLIAEDLSKRPYISVGFLALVLLVPLAVTSTSGWRRRLGRRWLRLHRAVYVAFALGLLHHFWLTKDGYGESVLYLVLFALLMTERLMSRGRSARRSLQPEH